MLYVEDTYGGGKWNARLYGTLAYMERLRYMERSLIIYVNVVHKRVAHPSESLTLTRFGGSAREITIRNC